MTNIKVCVCVCVRARVCVCLADVVLLAQLAPSANANTLALASLVAVRMCARAFACVFCRPVVFSSLLSAGV